MGVTSQVSEMMKRDAEIRQRIMSMYVLAGSLCHDKFMGCKSYNTVRDC